MPSQKQQLEAAIAAVEARRTVLGDAVVDASVGALRAQLAALAEANSTDFVQTLKQVTILFLDVVGSTALSQHLDPEAISEVMDGALYRLAALVEKHRGKVLKYAGDSILAVFGADEAREDDAERAVACGLAQLALGKVLGAEVQAGLGHLGFDVRVGIHTGDVLLGGGVDLEGAIAVSRSTSQPAWSRLPPLAGCVSARKPTPWCVASSRLRPKRRSWSKVLTSQRKAT